MSQQHAAIALVYSYLRVFLIISTSGRFPRRRMPGGPGHDYPSNDELLSGEYGNPQYWIDDFQQCLLDWDDDKEDIDEDEVEDDDEDYVEQLLDEVDESIPLEEQTEVYNDMMNLLSMHFVEPCAATMISGSHSRIARRPSRS